MSVYTNVSAAELENFLGGYAVGELVDFVGIAAGIENTNYFVDTQDGRFVLTLFEQTVAEELPYCLDLMAFLAERGIPSAHPVADRAGRYLQRFKDKPAALVQRLQGAAVSNPDREHCRVIGATLARLHEVAANYPGIRENERGIGWHEKTAALVRDRLPDEDRALLDVELDFRRQFDFDRLPQGVIHADLFHDNALFADHVLTGLIDFYYSHSGPLIYDLAVTICDWCFDLHDGLHVDNGRAMSRAYAGERAPNALEIDSWLACLRAAGLRFWLSRLKDLYFPRGGEITHVKDPEPFKAILVACNDRSDSFRAIWE